MFIQIFPSGPLTTNTYVVACAETREAAIIDAAPQSFRPISDFLADKHLKVQKILLTHSHWDHIADVKQFKDEYSIPVYIHSLDVPNLEQPGIDGLPRWFEIPPVKPEFLYEDEMQITLGHLKFKIIHTPGHSPGSVCIYLAQQHVLFTGDTLFKGSIGNLSFPTSQPHMMWSSLDKLAKLPSDTRVLPGHGEETTIQEESSWLSNAKNLFAF